MKRVLTSLLLIPTVVYVVVWGHIWLVAAVTAIVALLCYSEYAGIASAYVSGRLSPLGYAGLALLVWQGDPWPFVLGFAILALAFSLRAPDVAAALPGAGLLTLGVIYIFGSWKCAILIGEVSRPWLFFALVLNWVGDIAAYYVGRRFGRHKLAPRVSPGKSWEGAAASLAGSLLFGVPFLLHFAPATPVVAVVLLTAAANTAGQLGDLAESAMKRGAGVKDSGTILPGHGGFLDRVDSALFSLPVVWLYLRWAAAAG